MKAFYVLGLMLAVGTLVSAQNNCSFYKASSSAYYAVNKCSATSISTSVNPVCHANGTMTVYIHGTSSDCTGVITGFQKPPSSSFKCDGRACEVGFESGTISFTGSNNNCTSKSPMRVFYGVPGYCLQGDIYYCGTGGAYWDYSCSSSTTNRPPFVSFGQCLTSLTNVKVKSCTGGPAPPGGILGYKTANAATYLTCNFASANQTVYPIDMCEGSSISTKAKCVDADTFEVGTWLRSGCSGRPLTVSTYKRGEVGVDMLCTGTQCVIEQKSYTTTGCAGSSTSALYVPDKCTGFFDYKYYCYGTGNNKIFRENYGTTGCPSNDLSWSSNVEINTTCRSAGTSGSEQWSCTIGGAAPPFGSVGAGNMLSLGVSIVGVVLLFVFGV